MTTPAPVKVAGIIGHPLGHSISPAFQQAAMDSAGIRAAYQRWPTPPGELAERIASLRAPEVMGANVTVPHKETVMPLLDEVDGLARHIGAVNTIVNARGRLAGYNTDAPGFVRSLNQDAAFDPRGKRALVFGAGGAARAVAFALAEAGAHAIIITNRTASRAEALAASLKGAGPLEVSTLPWGRLPTDVDLIINTTTIGMRGGPAETETPLRAEDLLSPLSRPGRPALVVCDLVYNPRETPLLAEARKAGARTLEGLPMLVYQGAIAFELWTGRPAPVEVMFTAARRALGP